MPKPKSNPSVLFLSEGVPHPTRGASVVLLWEYVRALVERGWRVHHAIVSDHQDLGDKMKEYVATLDGKVTVEQVRAPKAFREMRFQVERSTRAAAEKLQDKARGFDAVFAFDIGMAAIAAQLQGPRKVVWLGDLLFDVRWYHSWYALREDWKTARHLPITAAIYLSWRRHYREVLGAMDLTIASSGSSVAKLARLGIRSEYWPYPWPAGGEPIPPSPGPAVPTFVFFGTLGGLGSRSALHFLISKLLPALRHRWGPKSFRIRICGTSSLPQWAAEQLAAVEEVEFLGFVDDLRALLADCTAMIAPLDVPVGNRSRIVTAMALQCPVISHVNAALGNPDLADGVNCRLASDVGGFVDAMEEVSRDQDRRQRLAEESGSTYRRTFAPGRAADRLHLALGDVVMDRQP